MSDALQTLQKALRDFARERDWEQFHTPKNLATALSVEAAELLEHFQWLTDEQSRTLDDAKRTAVGEELADVLLYLLQLADKLDIDPLQAAERKLRLNAEKYPADRARGRSDKYTEL
ncbi:nucleotide pyrophosphohydrolase [Lysobacter sp. A3-1-A15]|uniref:nucleotide pyrophosphohydrolase n=1 Tax=Novilysobacter viscosus TaxID=3098602 RepID=UPI002EDAA53E